MPLQTTVRTSPGLTAAAFQVWTTVPSPSRIRLTSTLAGDDPPSRYEKTTPRRAARNHFEVEVEVSSEGAPASRGPGAGVSSTFGSGGGGGRMRTVLLGSEWTPPLAIAMTGPLCASIGTPTTTTLAECARTFDTWSSL